MFIICSFLCHCNNGSPVGAQRVHISIDCKTEIRFYCWHEKKLLLPV